MLEQALRTFLLTFAAITAKVGTRIHVGQKKFTEDSELPAITIEGHLERNPLETYDGGATDLQFPQFDVVIHGLLFETTIEIGELVRRAFLNLQNGGTIAITVDGSPVNVTVEQLDFSTNAYCDDEEHLGHGYTDKPRVVTIQVGWRQNVTPL